MILLTVISYNGAPCQGPSSSFDELGGSIGRADNNQLVLPDPERTISRVHARIVFRGGGYAIVDNGSNPISVNGKPLGSGREHPLQPGDQVQIGGYLIEAAAGAAAARTDDPFADLFGSGAGGLATPAAPAPPGPAPAWAPPPPTPSPWPAPALAPGQIPDDWDPFAADPPPASPQPIAPATAAFDLGTAVPVGKADSLDDLFGLGPGLAQGDPLGGLSQQALGLQPNTAADADPLQALARPAPIAAASQGELGSELNTPMPLPSGQPSGAVFSWDKPSRDGRVVTLPGVRQTDAADRTTIVPRSEARAPASPPAAPRAVDTGLRPSAPAQPAPPQPAPAPAAAGEAALLAALLEGLAVPDLRLDRLSPELMKHIGELLHESTRGTVELLVARAALKREMRAQLTMIVARENNPLKFSPTVEAALQHLLGPQTPGFMAAAPALRDAFDDLRAHQIAVMAGMKAALDGVLQRFDPKQLEAKLTRRSALDSLIPAGRKARLWELFQELFGQLSSEAQDDFEELFGKAFVRAYEAQLDLLHGEPGPR